MIQISKSWGASLPRVACMALFVAASAQAQVSGGGGFGGGGFTPIPPAPVVRTADIQWSRNATSAYKLSNYTGSFYDTLVTTTTTSLAGTVRTLQLYTKNLTPTTFSYNSSGLLTGGAFANELTWTVAENPDTTLLGGSFTLSNLRWEGVPTGGARVLATASGTGLQATEVTAWTIASANMQSSSNQILFNNLSMPQATFALMMQAVGADFEGLGFLSMNSTVGNMGNLRIQGIPEASTWAQMALGLVGVGVLAQRRRRAAR